MVIVNVAPGAPLVGSTFTVGVAWPQAGTPANASTMVIDDAAAAEKRANRLIVTVGGYVEAASRASTASSTAAWPLGQNDRKSHRRHHSPAVAGYRLRARPSRARPRRPRTCPSRSTSQSTESISAGLPARR